MKGEYMEAVIFEKGINMNFTVMSIRKDGCLYYVLLKNQQVMLYPNKYLKYLVQTHASPNTVKVTAFSLAYYYHYLDDKTVTAKEVSEMAFLDQNSHFCEYLRWLKQGKHTDVKMGVPKNKTCNQYLRTVFGYYMFLYQIEEVSMLHVLTPHKVTYQDRMGVGHQMLGMRFRGYLKEEEPQLEEISKEEIQQLINACCNRRDKLLIVLLAETGFRIGEILGIRYSEDIDFEKRLLRVSFREENENLARAKNAEERISRLSDSTFSFLVRFLADEQETLKRSDYLFQKRSGKRVGKPLEADDVYSLFKRLYRKTKIQSHPHQMRHYFANERRKEGWDLNDIRYALGHKKVETTLKYLGDTDEQLIQASDDYYEAYGSLTDGDWI